MAKRVRITNDSLNSYRTRVLTAGIDITQYERNPVLLYMHQRGTVIGYMKDLKMEKGELTGEPVFDEATELSKTAKKQWEFGSLKMVSAGLDIIEMSDDPKLLVEGQTAPTITKSKLFEVSVVDIGANDDAIVLMREGKQISLGKDGENTLPTLNTNHKTKKEMDIKTIALQLGLPETASEAEVTAELEKLKASKQEAEQLKEEKKKLVLSAITALVVQAIKDKKIGEDKKAQFVSLGEKIGEEELKNTLDAMSPNVKLTTVIGHQGGKPTAEPKTFSKLSEVPPSQILDLREQNPDEYKRLYKAEYGIDCVL